MCNMSSENEREATDFASRGSPVRLGSAPPQNHSKSLDNSDSKPLHSDSQNLTEKHLKSSFFTVGLGENWGKDLADFQQSKPLKLSRAEYLRNYQRRWVAKRRAEWLKANGPCRRCGTWERLEVDHINRADKVSHHVWSWSKDRREAELKKCQVLCRQCHQQKSSEEERERKLGKKGKAIKLTASIVLEIYHLASQGGSPRAIARRFGIAPSMVIRIRDGERWTWLTKDLAVPAGSSSAGKTQDEMSTASGDARRVTAA